jgi:xanthine dehydrogenase YagR molybdenum-binding subunit
MIQAIGEPLSRVDGRLKVTGQARYAAEFQVLDTAYGVAVQSTIARGRIASISTSDAEAATGVLAVITHLNAPKLPGKLKSEGDPFPNPIVLQDDKINNFGQHIGVVVAKTFEQARYAASLVRVTYEPEKPILTIEEGLANAYIPEQMLIAEVKPETRRGDLEKGLSESDVQIEALYITPNEHNNPMEPHATIAVWDGPRLTLYDSTQNINGVQKSVAAALGMDKEKIHVVSPFVGGGFGCKGPVWEHVMLATMAAQSVGRPVKVVLARHQMFHGIGYRPASRQRMRLGAKSDGQLMAIGHEIHIPTNMAREFIEHVGIATPMMYESPNLEVVHNGVPLNWPRGTIMRAPGVTPGMFGLESAMDELAYALKMDPIELRIKNEPPRDPDSGLPWSSRNLVTCLRQGATAFGWEQRNREPRSMRDGRYLVGTGVACATFHTARKPTSARTVILPDGSALVQLAATDLGTGTYTSLTQVASEALGISVGKIRVEIGDSNFPPTPGSGGSWGAASYGSAVLEACRAARDKVTSLTGTDGGGNGFQAETYSTILKKHNLQQGVEGKADSKPGAEQKEYSMNAFGAQFAEVHVDPDTGEVRVTRCLGVFASGRIINEKISRSQLAGGIVMGLGMALMEQSVVDERYGNFVNSDFAGYHVPTNRDIPPIQVMFIEEQDSHVNPLGVKGLGEVGITGVAAAVGNAVYHATGKRIRELPITPDKLL